MQVFDFSPINESRRTCVSFEALNGRCPPFLPRALMHSLSARRDLLISAPSIPKNEKLNVKKSLENLGLPTATKG